MLFCKWAPFVPELKLYNYGNIHNYTGNKHLCSSLCKVYFRTILLITDNILQKY